MADLIGIGLGIIVGFGIGLYFGIISKSQKPWSELTQKEKKIRITLIIAGVILLIAGIITFFLFNK